MKEFCGDDVEVCQPSVGGLLAGRVLFQYSRLKYRRNYIVRKAGNRLNNHESDRTYIYIPLTIPRYYVYPRGEKGRE